MHHHYSTSSQQKHVKPRRIHFQYFRKVSKTETASGSAVASGTVQSVTRSTTAVERTPTSNRPKSRSMAEDDVLIYKGTQPICVNSSTNRGFSISSGNDNNATIAASPGASSVRVFGSQNNNADLTIMESKFKASCGNLDYKNKPYFSNESSQPDLATAATDFSSSRANGLNQPMKRVTLAERSTPSSEPTGIVLSQHDAMNTSSKTVPTCPPGVLSRPPHNTLKNTDWKIVGINSASQYQTSSSVRQPPQQKPKRAFCETIDQAIPDASKKRRNLCSLHPPPLSSAQSFNNLKKEYSYHGNNDIAKPFKAISTAPSKSYTANKWQGKGGASTLEFRPVLSEEQQRVLDRVVNQRQSIFFTGSAGTGKSVLLKAIIDQLKDSYDTGVAITASTGIAACNINGSTLHSFAGIGLGKEKADVLVNKIKERKVLANRWRNTKVLIIDEISMVDGELFDKLEYIARALRHSSEPFGGIQLVVTGDFYQLPPVSPYGPTVFAFEAKSWNTVIKNTVMLRKVFRQKDELFVRILNQMRVGILSDEAINTFLNLSRVPELHSNIQPTELYPLRKDVDAANNMRLAALPGAVRIFKSHDSGDPKRMDYFLAPGEIKLKINAQVMLLKNMDQTLVNGSLGIVVGFAGEGVYAVERKVRNRLAPNRYQGMNDEPDMDKNMTRGYPIVKFANDREVVIETESWAFELPDGEVIASRTQLPLMLAWAMSIHKSQGQTLDSVRVDLGEVFEMGQAYVALSRATSLDSLQILHFDASKVKAHGKVVEFYKKLSTV